MPVAVPGFMRFRATLAAAVFLLAWGLACAPDLADARASGGGSRGSRSHSAPAPNRSTQPSVTPPAGHGTITAGSRPSAVSRVMGFVVGGLVASIFLRALGFGGDWGIGLFDILLLIGAGFLLVAYLRDRGTTVEPIVVGTRKPR
jgi:uncharacterized membrane protein